MTDIRDQLSDPDLMRFYDYWSALCAGRRMPAHKDVDVTQIPFEYLPDLMLIDVLHEPRCYRYRLIGTNVAAASGKDRTGRFFDDVSFFKMNPAVLTQYDTVVDTGHPLYSLEPFTNFRNGTKYEADRLVLPLSGDGHRVDLLMVQFQFKCGPFARRLSSPRLPQKPRHIA
jgi:hypothetical protein